MLECDCETKYVVVCAYTKEMMCRCQVQGDCDCIMCSAFPAEEEELLELKIKIMEDAQKSVTRLVGNLTQKLIETEKRFNKSKNTSFVKFKSQTIDPFRKMNDQFKYTLHTVKRNSKYK